MRRQGLLELGIGAFVACSVAACNVGDGARGSFGDGGSVGPMAGDASDTDGEESGGESDEGDATDGGGETGSDTPANDDAAEYIEEAKKKFPTYLDLHTKVIQRTCTPNENVCHNNKEYPDLRTPQGVLDRLGQPCNLSELYADPEAVYNGCEPPGDQIRFTTGSNVGFTTEVGWIDLTDDGMGGGTAIVHIKDAIVSAMASPSTYESIAIERIVAGQTQMVGTIDLAVSYAAGARSMQVNYTDGWALHQSLLEAEITPGDPNRDDVYGASSSEAMHELAPGDPWNSYLLQRLQGNVPGSPMPLANQPLSAAEVIAVACWIEGSAEPGGNEVDSAIDYEDCSYAEEFAAPPEGGGATLSGHVQPIFDQYCAVAGCHAGDVVAEGLDLSAGNARASLVEVMARQNPDVPLVTPLNPTNSYLVTKLVSTGQAGKQMPLAAEPLGQSELDIIRTWIIQGAPDN
jgi:hypothetical protein